MASPQPATPPPAPVKRRRWGRIVAAVLVAPVLLALAALGLMDTSIGHRFLTDSIAGMKPSNGLRYSIGRIDGSIYGKAVLIDVRVRDPKGLVFSAPRAELDWAPLRYFVNRLDITSLHVPRATLARLPELVPSGKKGPILPGFDIRIGSLAIDRLVVAPPVAGVQRVGRIKARADIHAGRALVDLAAVVAGSDALRVHLDAEPDRNRLELDAHARGSAGGVLAKLSGFAKPIALDVSG
ncbi:hypothetical protein DBR17_05775, partial [Sphingomonas sp. HMWF008]